MREADRQAFDAQLEHLFGAFPAVPLTPQRRAAYWAGLAEMAIEVLERCVTRAIGPKGEERIPTSTRMWEISGELRVRPDSATNPNRPSVQYLLTCYVLKRFALSGAQRRKPWTYLYAGNPNIGSTNFAITGVIVPADDTLPAIRVMVSDIDLDEVWALEQVARAELERRAAASAAAQAALPLDDLLKAPA